MKDTSSQTAETEKGWALTEEAFSRLLSWLDEGANSGGEKYLETRRRLVSYFDRKNCLAPDELADETLNRVARRLKEASTDTAPAHYCYIVARFVFLEYLRRAKQDHLSLDELPASNQARLDPEALAKQIDNAEIEEKRLDCLERCLQEIGPERREIIIRYYHGEQRAKIENRRALAEELRVTINALSIRACRIRDRLEDCVKKCLSR